MLLPNAIEKKQSLLTQFMQCLVVGLIWDRANFVLFGIMVNLALLWYSVAIDLFQIALDAFDSFETISSMHILRWCLMILLDEITVRTFGHFDTNCFRPL